jgi:hypothetical protein
VGGTSTKIVKEFAPNVKLGVTRMVGQFPILRFGLSDIRQGKLVFKVEVCPPLIASYTKQNNTAEPLTNFQR